jgi:hypothetical protein
MAHLLIQTEGLEKRALHLRLGTNSVGRNPGCDFTIEHATVSSKHCEFVLSDKGVLLRDCNSTNGTFINGDPVKEAWLQPGQTVALGDVQLFVESTEIQISIPQLQSRKFPKAGVGSPVVMPKGALICPRHSNYLASYKCNSCNEVMCGKCVKSLKRQGGQPIFICPLCGGRCGRLNLDAQRKKTFLQAVRDTVKMPFAALSKRPPEN